jgi:hypothetical protein
MVVLEPAVTELEVALVVILALAVMVTVVLALVAVEAVVSLLALEVAVVEALAYMVKDQAELAGTSTPLAVAQKQLRQGVDEEAFLLVAGLVAVETMVLLMGPVLGAVVIMAAAAV